MKKVKAATQIKKRKDHPMYSKVVLSILESGLGLKEMDMESKSGLTMPNTKENGDKIKHVERASFGMQTEIILMGNGRMIRQVVMEFICILTALSMRACGKMTYKMDME
jgi:hypothetical protein